MKKHNPKTISCCPLKEIKKALDTRFQIFDRWMQGHMVVNTKGEIYIHKYDIEKWGVLKQESEFIHYCMKNISGREELTN